MFTYFKKYSDVESSQFAVLVLENGSDPSPILTTENRERELNYSGRLLPEGAPYLRPYAAFTSRRPRRAETFVDLLAGEVSPRASSGDIGSRPHLVLPPPDRTQTQ